MFAEDDRKKCNLHHRQPVIRAGAFLSASDDRAHVEKVLAGETDAFEAIVRR
jgi:hypothetical protein